MFLRDPCGIFCVIFTYLAIVYADYAVTRWIILETLQNSFWAPLHVILFNTVVFLLSAAHMKAVLSDPGVVPLPQNRLDFSNIHSNERKDDYEREDWTVCVRCETYRPPRAHHCRICRRCIRRFDHHCPWINNCVGERNQKYFLQFLVYVGFLSCYCIALVVMSWLSACETCSTEMADTQARMLHSILLFLESTLFGLFVVCIMVDQMTAIIYDESAVEAAQQKGKAAPAHRPKMALLREVCGRGPVCLWLVPLAASRKYDAALLSHDV